MATQAQYASVPKVGIGQISTANANRDGTGTIGTVFTAGTNGSRVDRIVIQAISNTTTGMVRLFLHDGANARLWEEVSVSAVTPSNTVPAFATTLSTPLNVDILPLTIPTGWSLRASTNNGEAFNVIAIGGDL
jgi:hypothetical protein